MKVKNSQLIDFMFFRDESRGSLFVAEAEKHIPFPIMRIYAISDVPDGISRGAHAHKVFDQVLVPLKGSFALTLDDGVAVEDIEMNDPSIGVRIGPGVWHSMSSFSKDCLILVFASHTYDESDYIREYDDFKKFSTDC